MNGSITFGVVAVPVKLFIATESARGQERDGNMVVLTEEDMEQLPLPTST